jgi:hypothetical protein
VSIQLREIHRSFIVPVMGPASNWTKVEGHTGRTKDDPLR